MRVTPYDAEISRLRNLKVHDWDDDYRRLLAKAEGYRAALSGDEVKALLEAARAARHRLSELNGLVSMKVWNGNYAAVHALDDAIAAVEEKP